jgi:quercetin dioxygenase-like cupin family protein
VDRLRTLREEAVMIQASGPEGYHELLPGVRLKTLVHGERTILTEVRFAGGAVVPVHAHPHEQTGYVVAGALRFTVDGEERVVRPGDSWNLPSAVPHGAVALEDSVVVEVFSPPREDYLALFDGA